VWTEASPVTRSYGSPGPSAPLRTGRAWLWTTVVLCALACAAPADAARLVFESDGRSATVETTRDGGAYFNVGDLAAVFGAVRHWNAQTGKMTLTARGRRLTLTPGDPFVALDGSLVNAGGPPVLRGGQVWVPAGFLVGPLARFADAEIVWLPDDGTVHVRHLPPVVRSVTVGEREDGTAIDFGLSGPLEFSVESPSRGSVDVFFSGARLVDSLAVTEGLGYVAAVSVDTVQAGVQARISVAGGAGGYTAVLYRDPYRVEIVLERGRERAAPALKGLAGVKPGAPGRAGGGVETVMIDPGHGGPDAGARGPAGLLEKDVTLRLADQLMDALRRKGFYVFMTRSSDSAVPLGRRAEIANMAAADIFVSLQCDAYPSPVAGGMSVSYYEPPAANAVGGARGAGLVRLDRVEVPPVPDALLWNRMQEDYIGESRALARTIHTSMVDALSLRDRGTERGTYVVLAGCAMPAVLVDVAFITSPAQEQELADPGFLREVASSIANGIAAYRSRVQGG
jgi:N-acetylmuramoyl-L-alanine amidase